MGNKPTTTEPFSELYHDEFEEENIKVAVRVRSFNEKEINDEVKRVIDMKGNTVILMPYETHEEKQFNYDFAYWSFDGFDKRKDGFYKAKDNRYCDQERIFKDIGSKIIKHGFAGYNATCFAYGQTGSGKTFTMFGTETNKGLVPMVCQEICNLAAKGRKNTSKSTDKTKDKNKGKNKVENQENTQEEETKVEFSMVQIYNEKVFDLLNPFGPILEIRESATGFFMPNVVEEPMNSSNFLELINGGLKKRVTAMTNVNKASSRSHVIIGIRISQVSGSTKKTSLVNLVDLAGSEQNKKTQSTGQRYIEANAINLSLSQLSLCLSELSKGENKFINFRDSALTMLLKNTLQNNGKTFMVATISPGEDNYSETLSTLRYAENAKAIKVKAKVNYETSEQVIIKQLKMEVERLKRELAKYQSVPRDIIEKYSVDSARNKMDEQVLN